MPAPTPLRKLRPAEIDRASPALLAALPRHPVAAILDNVRSIHNVGSMFRTADATRLLHLHLAGYTGTPAHRDLHRTALGAEDTVPWSHEPDADALVARLRAAGYTIAVLELTDRPTDVEALGTQHFPLVFVVGNEVDGVRDTLVAAADVALELPQFGAKASLNVANAFAVAAYDLVRHARRLGLAPA